MNRTFRLRIVAVVLATCALTAIFTIVLLKRMPPPLADVAAQANSAPNPAPNQATTADDPQPVVEFAPMSRGAGRVILAMADPVALSNLQSQVKARQDVEDGARVTIIDLKPYVNAALTDPLADQPNQTEHTLARLPAGVHTYGGVRFDVEGLIQLSGTSIPAGPKPWPEQVTSIAIGKACQKLHLFHGAFNIDSPRQHTPFAKLILHYADGTQQELELDGGVHALRCLGPAVPPMLNIIQAPQTELGWLGSNAALERLGPAQALHLYRTTLDNPKPDVVVTSLDYVSVMDAPAPFLAGLSIE